MFLVAQFVYNVTQCLLATEALGNQHPETTQSVLRLLQLWVQILEFVYWISSAEIG
jgi:hypothetical protein